MTKSITVEGDITAVDTRTLISTQGSVTAPSLVVPSGSTKIDRVIVAFAQDGAAVGGATFFVRLGGNAVLKGEQVIVCASGGTIAVQAGSDQNYPVVPAFVLEDADISVSASDTVSISVEMAGSDLGTARAIVTLIFA